MNRLLLFSFFLIMSILSFYPEDIEALGGRGGGFRGDSQRGHSDRMDRSNRTPSMSRSEPRDHHLPTNQGWKDQSQDIRSIARPRSDTTTPFRNDFPDEKAPNKKRSYERNDFNKQDARRFNNQQVDQRDFQNNTINIQPENRTYENAFNQDRKNDDRLKDRKNWFDKGNWNNHPHAEYHHHHDEGINWWKAATWTAVSAWIPWKWNSPIYYSYGPGGNIYYSDNNVYLNGQIVASDQEYLNQAENIISDIPPVDKSTIDWLPLGVFSLSSGSEGEESTMFLQIAVSKEGILSGSYINTVSSTILPIDGRIDKKSQRAVWKVNSSKGEVIMETGAYNLTQKETGIFIHFPNGTTQTWLMSRTNKD